MHAPEAPASMAIRNERLEFRPASVSDAPVVASLMTADISKWVAAWPFPLSVEQARTVLKDIDADAVHGRAHPFLVGEMGSGKD